MAATITEVRTSLLPVGVRHYNTTGFADSWDAYDALKAEDGWGEHEKDDSSWKRLDLPEGHITVFSPMEPRND